MYYNPVGIFKGVSWTSGALGDSDPKVGDVCFVDSEQYRFIYNNGASSAPVSKGLTLTAAAGYSLTVSSTTSVDILVGVVKHAAIAASAYGWVVQKGFCTVALAATESCAAGAILVLAADGLFANKTSGIGYIAPAQVKAMSAMASGASGLAYIFCG